MSSTTTHAVHHQTEVLKHELQNIGAQLNQFWITQAPPNTSDKVYLGSTIGIAITTVLVVRKDILARKH